MTTDFDNRQERLHYFIIVFIILRTKLLESTAMYKPKYSNISVNLHDIDVLLLIILRESFSIHNMDIFLKDNLGQKSLHDLGYLSIRDMLLF